MLLLLDCILSKIIEILLMIVFILSMYCLLGYELADLTVLPPTPKRSRVGSYFSHRYLVPPKFFPQRKSGFSNWTYKLNCIVRLNSFNYYIK